MSEPTERERIAIEALVSTGKVQDAWTIPIDAVNRALQLSPTESRDLVWDMMRRGLVAIRTKALNREDPDEQGPHFQWWEQATLEDLSEM